MFLGYPSNTKGYKLFDLKRKITFISRNVIFIESIFPYNTYRDEGDETQGIFNKEWNVTHFTDEQVELRQDRVLTAPTVQTNQQENVNNTDEMHDLHEEEKTNHTDEDTETVSEQQVVTHTHKMRHKIQLIVQEGLQDKENYLQHLIFIIIMPKAIQ